MSRELYYFFYYNIPRKIRELQPNELVKKSQKHYNIPRKIRELQLTLAYIIYGLHYNIPRKIRELQQARLKLLFL